jgi:hypothetical protein
MTTTNIKHVVIFTIIVIKAVVKMVALVRCCFLLDPT